MIYLCTLSDKNYLLKGLALHQSLQETIAGSWILYWLCLDEETSETLIALKLPNVFPISLQHVEEVNPELQKAKNNPPSKYGNAYSQYCWTLTPYFICLILLNIPHDEVVLYVDSDLFFYDSPERIIKAMQGASIGIHTHRFSGEFDDDIEVGWYNVGAVAFRNNKIGNAASKQWQEWLLKTGHQYYEKYGTCGDQKYLNLFMPLFGEVNVCVFDQSPYQIGHLAPWNCNNVVHPAKHHIYYKNVIQDVLFFHFSHFRCDVDKNEWFDSNNGEWNPSRDPNILPYYRDYFEVIKTVSEKIKLNHK